MKNIFLLFAIGLLTFQCKQDNPVREQAKAEAVEIANKPAEPVAAVANPAPGFTQPTVNDMLTLALGNNEAKTGDKTCLPVNANGFNDLIGLQYSIRWDAKELTYTSIENMTLTDLTLQNFGATHAELGVVVMSWIHQSLKGVTLAPDSKLFDICFTPNTKPGTTAKVRFDARPTPYEVISSKEDLLRFTGIDGMVKVID